MIGATLVPIWYLKKFGSYPQYSSQLYSSYVFYVPCFISFVYNKIKGCKVSSLKCFRITVLIFLILDALA